jgi:FKBP-type peptidyl-prolyl cis-trans isomerase
MRIFLIWLLFCTTLHADEKVKKFLQTLSFEQKLTLESFLKTIVKGSFSGYVLYGDKPICIEAYSIAQETGALSGVNEQVPILIKGIKLWEDLQINPICNEFFFLTVEAEPDYRHLICINRKAFLETVNQNLPLFRYVLGPTITAELLLQKLIQSKNNFYKIIHDDHALLGILLGYGTQNSILVSRKERISGGMPYVEEFPLIAKKSRNNRETVPYSQSSHPSLGFTSFKEEEVALQKATTISRKLKPFNSYELPYFGCEPNSNETQHLLDKYEKNRIVIKTAYESEDFLEMTLLKLFKTTSNSIEIPSIPKERPNSLADKEESAKRLAQLVREEIQKEKRSSISFLNSFISGLQSGKNGIPLSPSTAESWKEFWQVQKGLEGAENLERAESYFQTLAAQKTLRSIISNRIYYETLRKGEGPPLSSKVKHVSFHYSFTILDGSIQDIGTLKQESIEFLIPGIAHALIGMKKKEERKVYIHPEYAYGQAANFPSSFPSNAAIIANIQLLDFVESNADAVIAPIQVIEKKNRKDLAKRYEKLRQEEFCENGALFWGFLQKCQSVIDIQTFLDTLLFPAPISPFILRTAGFLNFDGPQSGPDLNDHRPPILMQYRSSHDRSNLDHSEAVKIQESNHAQCSKDKFLIDLQWQLGLLEICRTDVILPNVDANGMNREWPPTQPH